MTCSRSHRKLKGRILTLVVAMAEGLSSGSLMGSLTLPMPFCRSDNFLLSHGIDVEAELRLGRGSGRPGAKAWPFSPALLPQSVW